MNWVVETNQGGVNWTPIAYYHSKAKADQRAAIHEGSPVRVREYGKLLKQRTKQKPRQS